MKKACPECGDLFTGRSDKKFCSDACRNNFNNKLNSDQVNIVRNINNSLRKNRRIMQSLLTGDMSKVHRDTLLKSGFDFNYITHLYTTKKGATYRYCYEYGYLPLEGDRVLLVKREEKGAGFPAKQTNSPEDVS